MSDNIVHTSATATNTAQNFAETVKIYQQYKKYYDALKIREQPGEGCRKVSEIILMVGDVSEIYVTNFRKMLAGGREFFPAGTGRHRLRVHPAAGREQRRAAGPETGHQCQYPLDDGQGPDGCGGRLSCQHAPLPQPGELLYEPEHCREYPPCPEEERSGPRTGTLRK